MYLKTYKSGTQFIVAVCDKDLLGKILKEGDVTVEVSEEFYKGHFPLLILIFFINLSVF